MTEQELQIAAHSLAFAAHQAALSRDWYFETLKVTVAALRKAAGLPEKPFPLTGKALKVATTYHEPCP